MIMSFRFTEYICRRTYRRQSSLRQCSASARDWPGKNLWLRIRARTCRWRKRRRPSPIKYHPHSGWFEVTPPRGASSGEGPIGADEPTVVFHYLGRCRCRNRNDLERPRKDDAEQTRLAKPRGTKEFCLLWKLRLRPRLRQRQHPMFPGTAEPLRISPAKPVAYSMELLYGCLSNDSLPTLNFEIYTCVVCLSALFLVYRFRFLMLWGCRCQQFCLILASKFRNFLPLFVL